jgi:hypothetical protein
MQPVSVASLEVSIRSVRLATNEMVRRLITLREQGIVEAACDKEDHRYADTFDWHRSGQDDLSPGSTRRSWQGARSEEVLKAATAGVHREHADGIDMARSRVADHGSEVVEGSSFSSWVAQAGSRCVLRVRHFRMGCDRLAIQRSLPRVESYSPAIRSRTPHGPRWGSQ